MARLRSIPKLSKPILKPITTFDPRESYIFEFTYDKQESETVPIKNKAIIYDANTYDVVYESTQNNLTLRHELPGNTLTAGNRYCIQVQTFDALGNESELSEPNLFYCFTTPIFNVVDIYDGMTYRLSDITINTLYEQLENEELNSIEIMQYDYTKSLIKTSGTLYEEMSYSFHGLENANQYYFRVIGETVHGIKLDTGYIGIDVLLQRVPADIFFECTNEYCKGYIQVVSNIKDIGYVFIGDDYSFEDGHLILGNSSLIYNEGFKIEKDQEFSLFIEASALPLGDAVIIGDKDIILSIENICGMIYAKLTIKGYDVQLFAQVTRAWMKVDSDEETLLSTEDGKVITMVSLGNDPEDFVIFDIKRKNGLYSLEVYYKEERLRKR